MGRFDQSISIPLEALEESPEEAAKTREVLDLARRLGRRIRDEVQRTWEEAGGEGPAPGAQVHVRFGWRRPGGE